MGGDPHRDKLQERIYKGDIEILGATGGKIKFLSCFSNKENDGLKNEKMPTTYVLENVNTNIYLMKSEKN